MPVLGSVGYLGEAAAKPWQIPNYIRCGKASTGARIKNFRFLINKLPFYSKQDNTVPRLRYPVFLGFDQKVRTIGVGAILE